MSNKLPDTERKPSLVHRLTRTFLIWMAAAYLLSLVGLWWSSNYLVRSSLAKELQRISAEYDEMGTTIFFSNGSAAITRVREAAAKNADILFVRYYHASDAKLLGEYVKDGKTVPAPTVNPKAQVRADDAEPQVLTERRFGVVSGMRIIAPVRTRSYKSDQLLDLDNSGGRQVEISHTIGYLEIGADLGPSRRVILNMMLLVAGVSTLLLMLALYFGRRHVRKSLASLLGLQEPLEQLAAGNFNVAVEHNARDREVATVCDAVNTTIEALRVRNEEKEAALRAKLEAEAASQAKSQFLAHMSHEIRTPLNGIMGFLKLLSKTPLTGTQKEYLHTTEVSAKTLLTVINDILDFSKIEAGKISTELLEIELRELLEEVMSLHAANAEEKGLELVFVYNKQVPNRLMGDPARISQILSNLVGNAIKFTQRGEVVVTVNMKEETDADVLVDIAVRDTGIGIPPEALKRLFQPFSQADASTTRQYGGTGLGLIISQRLAELMGGNISVDSEPGRGTCFTISLRLPKQDPAFVPLPLADLLAAQRVLTVTPNASVARALEENLASWGMQSDATTNGQAALRAMEQANYGAVIYDQSVKDMAPEYFLGRLKESGRQQLPIILLGSLAESARIQANPSKRYAGGISKPAKSSELYNELTRIFAGGRHVVPERDSQANRLRLVSADGRRLRVLIVDDNDINRKLAKLLIEQLDGDADLAENGAQAVDACGHVDYDLVLMDVHMPVMDGLAATSRIREAEKDRRHTLIVALTANAMSGDRERYLAAGMDEYLGKPINEKAFIATLQRLGLASDSPAPSPLPGALPDRTEPSPSALPVLDPNLGEKLAFGDRAMWRNLLDMLFKQLPDNAMQLKAEQEARNADGVKQIAHKIAGASSYCGTPSLHQEAIALENRIKAGEIEAALQSVDELIRQIEKVLALQGDTKRLDGDLPIF